MKLVKSRVEALPVPAIGQAFHWDDELKGFGVRVTPNGIRSYVAQSRVKGKSRRVTIGTHGRWTCEEARRHAREVLREMDLGVDPQEKRRQEKAKGVTLREIADAYMRDRDLKQNSKNDIEKHLKGTLSIWAEKPAASITRDHCLTRFRTATQRSPAQANQAFVILRALLNYARAAYRAADGTATLPENPVAVLSETKLWNKERARTTRIQPDRVGAVWHQLAKLRDEARTRHERTCIDYVCFLLLTGARGSEAAELTWDRVALVPDGVSTWHLPDPKNGRPVTFPLCRELARVLLARKEEVANDERFVFACWGKSGHLTDARATLDKLSNTAGLRVTRHDLRRTFTGLALDCGLEMWKVELLTGHVPQTVTLKHYMETSDLRYLSADLESVVTRVTRDAKVFEAMQTGHNVVAIRA